MRTLVTGATGFVGRALLAALRERGERPAVLSRDAESARRALGDVDAHAWDPSSGPAPAAALRGVQAIFHLAGEPIGEGRWDAAKKARIRESRVGGTRNLVRAIEALPPAERPRVLVAASAVGIYGSRGDEVLDEAAPPGTDFLSEVCRSWEAEAVAAAALGVRVVSLRIGIVLGPGGGAIARLLPLFRRCLGGRITVTGKQWMPWVHVDDAVGLALLAAERAEASGPLNVVAPNPARNRDFTRALSRVLGRPALFPAPGFLLRLGLGEFADVLIGSQRVAPRVAERLGYAFRFPDLEAALRAATEVPAVG